MKNLVIKYNHEISNLNAEYSRIKKDIISIKKEIKANKYKKLETFIEIKQVKIFQWTK